MRYFTEKPKYYTTMFGETYHCNHPIYNTCTLYKIGYKGVGVIQQRYDAQTKHMDSILTSIKKLLGMDADYIAFDTDVIIHINTALAILCQLGVGPDKGFRIRDNSATWQDFVGDDARLDDVKDYVYLKVKLLFDPPSSSAAIQSTESLISEIEWRLNVTAEMEV